HHVKLAIAQQTRYSPKVVRIKEMLAAGRLGDLMELRGRGKEDHRAGATDLITHGPHIFDLMRAFAGNPKSCYAEIAVAEKGDFRPATKADIKPGIEGNGHNL